ncbi:baseplate J/gp47 family protein [Dorea sp. D27]|uniref:baseplate J/gp47 family protein n=1 Tax=Dorea sp. D27 TaxID=658665 RepID=UPI0006739E67|nr:baseplate J/gp47 family protein [Dorea sp. D27]KMZ53598.1 hypothetical protein HMPREF0980_02467 [Dorea sp. D27]
MIEELEQLMEEAVSLAGIYSEEWTNRYPSDPGITILENLSALHFVQREAAAQVTEDARIRLLKLAGFMPQEPQNARLAVELAQKGPLSFPKHQKFYVDDVCFETEGGIREIQGRLLGVYVKGKDGFHEVKELKEGVPLNARPFGSYPAAGDAVYFLFDELPRGRNVGVRLYAEVRTSGNRNPFSEGEPVDFARMQWSCLTSRGHENIVFQDDTHGFLQSGGIVLWIDTDRLVKEQVGSRKGYMLCCRIVEAAYDRPPEIEAVYGPLFFLLQRDTQSFSVNFKGGEDIRIWPVYPEETFLFVYVKEQGRRDYVRYTESAGPGSEEVRGRHYEQRKMEDGRIQIRFLDRRHGFSPTEEENAVIVICCNREMMLHRELGVLEGWENQKFDLPPGGGTDAKALRIGVRRPDTEENAGCMFFRPGADKRDSVYYTYDDGSGQICIHDAGAYTGCHVFLADYALSVWDGGNIRFGNELISAGGNEGVHVRNPVKGRAGRAWESVKDIRKRFLQDLIRPVSAVTEKDYKVLAMQTPGLCIRKVSAYYEERRDQICVVVMAGTEESFPRLSPLYRRQIERYLDRRKILTAKVTVKDPTYTRVDVYVTVSVRDRERWDIKKARQEIAKELDDRRNDREIGQMISFDRLSGRIRACPGTGHILELKTVPAGVPGRLIRPGTDIPIPPDAACYPGEIVIREE